MKLEFNYYTSAVAITFFIIHFIYHFIYRFIKLHSFKDSNLKLSNNSISLAKEILIKQNQKCSFRFTNNYFINWNQKDTKVLFLPKTNDSFNNCYYTFEVISRSFLYLKFKKNNNYLEYYSKIIWFILNINIIWTLVFNLWIISLILFTINLLLLFTLLIINQKFINNTILSTIEFLKWQIDNQEDFEMINNVSFFYKKYYLDLFLCSLFSPISSFAIWFKNWGKDE